MHKKIFTIALLILMLTLTACGSSAQATQSANTGTQFDPTTRELPLSSKLAIGTLKLEGTENAIAPDQAASLLPLWQVLKSLSASSSAAPEEIDAVVNQIHDTMTPEQIAAIDALNLTGQNIFTTMQELGLTTGGQVNAQGTPQPGRDFSGFPGGGVPGGGPGQGGGPGGDQGISPEQIATAQARRAANGGGFGNRTLTPLMEAVIKLLESKAQ